MRIFRENKIAVWIIAVLFKIFVLILGGNQAVNPVYKGGGFSGRPRQFVEYSYDIDVIVYTLMIVTAIFAVAFFITRPLKDDHTKNHIK